MKHYLIDIDPNIFYWYKDDIIPYISASGGYVIPQDNYDENPGHMSSTCEFYSMIHATLFFTWVTCRYPSPNHFMMETE